MNSRGGLPGMSAYQAVSQLPLMQMSMLCHSGLDPWFHRPFDRLTVLSKAEGLTTLSEVEGESNAVPALYAPGCRIKSGMTF